MKLFACDESREYLKDHIARLPKGGRGEVSRIASHLGVSSTLVSQILAGRKLLTPEQAARLAPFLGLAPLEVEYWNYLVQKERAGSPELRAFWKKRLAEARAKSQKLIHRVEVDRPLKEADRAVFYSSFLYSAVRLFATSGKQGRTLDEVARRFELSRARASEILGFLTGAGLCTEKNGRYQMGIQKTHLEQGSPYLPRHYANWRLRALERAERLTEEELMYSAPVSLSQKDFLTLRAEMAEFIRRFLDRVHASPAEEVACLNLDFFWVK